MPAQLSPCPRLHFLGKDGHPLADGYLITYDFITSQPVATWADAEMTTPNPVQLSLNANGEPCVNGKAVGVYLENGKMYKFIWFDKHGEPIGDSEPLQTSFFADIESQDGTIYIEKWVEGNSFRFNIQVADAVMDRIRELEEKVKPKTSYNAVVSDRADDDANGREGLFEEDSEENRNQIVFYDF